MAIDKAAELNVAFATSNIDKVKEIRLSLEAVLSNVRVHQAYPLFDENGIRLRRGHLPPFDMSVEKAKEDLEAVDSKKKEMIDKYPGVMNAIWWMYAHKLLDEPKLIIPGKISDIGLFHDVESMVNRKYLGQPNSYQELVDMALAQSGKQNIHWVGLTGINLHNRRMAAIGVKVVAYLGEITMPALMQQFELTGVERHLKVAGGLSMGMDMVLYDQSKPLTMDVYPDILNEPDVFTNVLNLPSWGNLPEDIVRMLKDGYSPKEVRNFLNLLR